MSEKTESFFVHGQIDWIILLLERALKGGDRGDAYFACGVTRRVQKLGGYKKMSDLGRWYRAVDWVT